MAKAWRGEHCLLQSSSPSSGSALFPDFHFFKYLWECQNFFAFFVWNILQSYSEHIALHPGCIRLSLCRSLPPSVSPSCGVSFFSPILSQSSRKAAAWPALPLWVARGAFSHIISSSARGWPATQQLLPQTGLEFTALVSSSELSNCLPGDHQCHWFCTLFSSCFLSQCFSVLMYFHILLLLLYLIHFSHFLIIIILCTLHDKAQSVFWSGYYTH